MAYKLELNLFGADESFKRGVDTLYKHLAGDLTLMLDAVKTWWYSEQALIFGSEGGRLNGQWNWLTPDYDEWKRKNYGDLPILVLSGDLKKMMTGVDGVVEKQDEQNLEIYAAGKALPYWKTHNFGYSDNNIPQREFLGIADAGKKTLNEAMRKVLNDVKREAQKEFDKSNSSGKKIR